MRVFVRFKDENVAGRATGPYVVGNSIVVCAIGAVRVLDRADETLHPQRELHREDRRQHFGSSR